MIALLTNPRFLASLLSALLVLFLWRLNLPTSRRHRQWWLPSAAVVVFVIAALLLILLRSLEAHIPFLGQLLALLEASLNDFGSLVRQHSPAWLAPFTRVEFIATAAWNLGILLLFVLFKLLFSLPARWLGGRRIFPLARPFYVWWAGEGVVLRPPLTFLSRYLGYAAGAGLALLLGVQSGLLEQLRLLVGRPLQATAPLSVSLALGPGWATVIFLLLAESAWFLGGLLPYALPGDITGEDADSHRRRYFRRIISTSKRIWGPWLLTTTDYPTTSADTAKLDYERVERALFEGRNVLIENATLSGLTPNLRGYLEVALGSGRRLLVLAPRENLTAAAQTWLRALLEDVSYSVATFGKDLTAYGAGPQVLLASLEQPLEGMLAYDWAPELSVVIVLDTHELLIGQRAEFSTLWVALAEKARTPPQLIALADWRVSAEPMLSNLGIAAEEIRVQLATGGADVVFWRLERPIEQEFYNRLLTDVQARPSEEMMLSLVPICLDFMPITIAGQGRLPLAEDKNELANSRDALRPEYHLRDLREVKLVAYWQLAEPLWSLTADDYPIVITRDVKRNALAALQPLLPLAKERALIELVSPPYLLRDYLVHRLASGPLNPRAFSSLSPGSDLNTGWWDAYLLYERLRRNGVALSEVREVLKHHGVRHSESLERRGTRGIL